MQFSRGGENPKSKWRLFNDLAIKTVAHRQPRGETLSLKLKNCLNLAICLKKKGYFRKLLEAVSPFDDFWQKNKTLMLTTTCSQFSMWSIYYPYLCHIKAI
jgi:hypothetical protein